VIILASPALTLEFADMNFFNLSKRNYKKWLNMETCGFLKTGRAGEAIDPPARSVCVRKFAHFLLDFNQEQLKICWQMAGLIDKPEIETQGQQGLIRELAKAAREQEDPVEGHLLAHNFLQLNLDETPDDDQAAVEALDSPVVADPAEEQNDSDLLVVSGDDVLDIENEDDPLFGPLLPPSKFHFSKNI